MICKFCGLNNADDAAFCSRCGSELGESRVVTPVAPKDGPSVDDDKKTRRMDHRPGDPAAGGLIRHSCGYPLLPGTRVCPNCNTPVDGVPGQSSDHLPDVRPNDDAKKTVVINNPGTLGQEVMPKVTEQTSIPGQGSSDPKKTERFAPSGYQGGGVETSLTGQGSSDPKKTERFVPSGYQGGGVDKRTVNFRQMKQEQVQKATEPDPAPHCALKPIARAGETAAPARHDYGDAKVILNRQNTDPTNPTITSQQQALLTFENGKWYIEDRSAYKTTYVRVTKKMEVQEGDVIGLGDREFEFTTK